MYPPQPPQPPQPPWPPQPPGPPTRAGWVTPLHILAGIGCLIEVPVATALLSRQGWPIFAAGALVCLVMFALFMVKLPKAAPGWSDGKRVASSMFLSFGLMGWITLILGAAFVGLLAGACFCTKR